MKKIFLFFLITVLFVSAFGQGYKITVQYKPAENSWLFLGYYFGEKKYVQDSAKIAANGTVLFTGTQKLTGGLYIIVDEKKQRFFDLLIDKEQDFVLSIDTSNFTINSITGSVENKSLEDYKKASSFFFRNYKQWQQELAQTKNKKDSLLLQDKMNAAANKSQKWRDSFVVTQPASYLALLFRLMKEPLFQVGNGKTKADSANAYIIYKKQYWQDISFADERLLRTPMFEQRLTRYFDAVVVRHPDSIKVEIDKFILYSRTNKTMYRYFINRFTNEYMNPKYMGLDVVFLHLFEKYYLTNEVNWLEPKDKDLVFNRAYSLMGNILGEPAVELNMLDVEDKKVNLYSISASYTLLVFWDPDCGHCREQVPVIDSLYKANWKATGMKLVGILSDTVRTDKSKLPLVKQNWVNYVNEHGLNNWLHLYQSFEAREEERIKSIPGFRQSYDVYQTPTIYLLDKDKRIVAKKISPEQIDDFLKFQQNKTNPKHP